MAWWLFQHLAVTTALALGVAVVLRLTRLGPVARHALWLVVLIKLMTPPFVSWPWAAPDPLQAAAFGQRDQDLDRGAHRPVANGGSIADEAIEAEAMRPGFASADELKPVWPWIVAVWLGGSLLLAAVEGIRLRRLARELGGSRPADPAFAQRVAAACEGLGLRPIDVRVIAGRRSPAVWGFGRARLLWPAELPPGVSAACIDGLLAHELAHVKRGDHRIGWLELIAGILWWWNPLFWSVRAALREQAELACDAWVIAALPNGRRAYAESLLAFSGASLASTPSMAVVGVQPTRRLRLERRLIMIMQSRAPIRLTRTGLFSIAVLAAAALPGWAAQNPPPAPTPAVPVHVVVPVQMDANRDLPSPPVAVQVKPIRVASARAAGPSRVTPPGAAAVPVEPTPATVAGAVRPQRGGSIFGRVTDASLAALSGAQVTVSGDAIALPMVALTNSEGRFQFPLVPPGRYTVTYDLDGYRRQVRMNIIIERAFHAEIDARLERGTAEPASIQLPAAGRDLLSQFQTASEQIRRDADRQIEWRRQALIDALEKLMTELTNAGRTDDVAAVRELIRRLRTRDGGGG